MLIKWKSTRRDPIGQLVALKVGLSPECLSQKLIRCGGFCLVVQALNDLGVASELLYSVVKIRHKSLHKPIIIITTVDP